MIPNAVVSAQTGGCGASPPNQVGWWRAEGDATDTVGRAAGVEQGAVVYATGMVGQAFSLNGVDAHIDGTNSYLPQANAPRTFEAWINPHTEQNGTIFNYGAGFTDNRRSGMLYIGGRLYLVGQRNDVQGAVAIPPGRWTHVAIAYDGANASLYVDGRLDVTRPLPAGPAETAGFNWRIGAGSGLDSPFEPFDGLVDEVSVYDRALSAVDIRAIFEAGATGKCNTYTLTFDPPDPSAPVESAPPRNLVATLEEGAAKQDAAGSQAQGGEVIAYKVYRSRSPNVQRTPENLLTTLPPTQTSLPGAPGGFFYIVTACYGDGSESDPSNETSAGAGEARIKKVKISGNRIVAKGTGFTEAVEVMVDGKEFSTAAAVKRNLRKGKGKVTQVSPLLDGQTLEAYLRSHSSFVVSFRNSNGAVASFKIGQ